MHVCINLNGAPPTTRSIADAGRFIATTGFFITTSPDSESVPLASLSLVAANQDLHESLMLVALLLFTTAFAFAPKVDAFGAMMVVGSLHIAMTAEKTQLANNARMRYKCIMFNR